MAQNVTIAGASYSNVPGINIPKTGSGTAYFADVTATTATESDVASGKIFYKADGTQATGTASGGGGGGGVVITDTTDSAGGTIRTITAANLGSDTVTAGSMLSGVTAHDASGTAITGSIQTKTSSDIEQDSEYVYVPDGYYASGVWYQTHLGTEGTPIATKGTVSNHTISVTPSVTNQWGYIAGSPITGTPVTVTASELESGTKSITANGTGIDVTGDSAVNVSVTGSSKNFQISDSIVRVNTSAYAGTGISLTVAATGTYNVYWWAYRSSTSGTNGTALYKNGSIVGSNYQTWDSTYTNVQKVKITGVSLTKDDVIEIYARARSTSYYVATGNLTIEQTA